MAKRIDVSDLDIYYGDFLAVEDVSMTVEPRSVTAFIGPSGCGKSTFLRSLNRMHEVIPGARVEGKVMLDDEDLYGADVDPVAVRRTSAWSSSGRTRSRRCRSTTTSSPGCKLNAGGMKKADADDVVERSLRGANLWDEVKDRLERARARAVRRPAAAAVHRPRDRGRAAGPADGRAVLGARPDLDRAPSRT